MKPIRLLLALALLLFVPSAAGAQGVVSLSWDACTGPVNKTGLAGTQVALFASLLGQSQTAQAYQVQISIGSSSYYGFPDAWRFDPAGCQGSGLIVINHTAPAAVVKACPSFQGALQSVQVKDFSFDALTGRARAVLYNSYPNYAPNSGAAQGNPVATNPAQRYFLGRFLFDEAFGATGPTDPGNTCGGLEKGLCFHLDSQTWLDLAGAEQPWSRDAGQAYVTVNGPVVFVGTDWRGYTVWTCDPPVPARPVTWGAIKNQYR